MDPLYLVFWLIVCLGIYEASRGVVALRKGERLIFAAKDFLAAAFIGALVVLILYVWCNFFKNTPL